MIEFKKERKSVLVIIQDEKIVQIKLKPNTPHNRNLEIFRKLCEPEVLFLHEKCVLADKSEFHSVPKE